jgi:hypothetical protein
MRTQEMYIANGDRGSLILRGIDLNSGTTRIYAEEYLGNVYSVKAIDGRTALAKAVFGTRILDLDDNSVL